ncbi:MAG: DUF1028 domain-containing protein [Terriglobales bacterium]
MRRIALAVLLFSTSLLAQLRPVHTFSIVARDPATGEIGVAVQSHWFAVGQIVPWAEAGVGAVATQSFVDPSYGKLGLDFMRAGKSAPQAMRALLAADEHSAVRQVAIIDGKGKVAAWTGGKDIQSAGHRLGSVKPSPNCSLPCDLDYAWQITTCEQEGVELGCGEGGIGEDFSVQANLMASDKVWPAMAKAYEEATGDLADRMLAALDAAQAVGGDIRGRQSAALIVVKAKPSGKPWEDRVFDLRVDDNVEPLKELRRLVTLQRAYNHMNAGDLAVEHKDHEAALREYAAAEKLASTAEGIPASRLAEMTYWHAVALVNMKRVEESLPLFKKVFAMDEHWRTLTPRLSKAGLLPDDPKLMERIVAK